MLRAKVGFKITGSMRSVTEAQEKPGLCAATLVRWIQQVRRHLLGGDCCAGGIRNRHSFAAVYQSAAEIARRGIEPSACAAFLTVWQFRCRHKRVVCLRRPNLNRVLQSE